MINFDGIIVAVSSPEDLNEYIHSDSVLIYCGDPADMSTDFAKIGAVSGVALVPDYQALQLYVNGSNGYLDYYRKINLTNKAATQMLATMLQAAIMGKNVILYFPPETKELLYPNNLLSYIWELFGVQVKTKSTDFFFNPQHNDFDIRFIYDHGLIDGKTMLANTNNVPILTESNVLTELLLVQDIMNDYVTDVSLLGPSEGREYIRNAMDQLKRIQNGESISAFGTTGGK